MTFDSTNPIYYTSPLRAHPNFVQKPPNFYQTDDEDSAQPPLQGALITTKKIMPLDLAVSAISPAHR